LLHLLSLATGELYHMYCEMSSVILRIISKVFFFRENINIDKEKSVMYTENENMNFGG